jgi:hypothetical protein
MMPARAEGRFRAAYEKYFGERHDLRVKLYNVLAITGCLISAFMALQNFLTGFGLFRDLRA